MKPKISIIIPVLNEQQNLPFLFESFNCLPFTEIIFVDGGSDDESRELINRFSATTMHDVKLLNSKRSRSVQMNKGAETAAGELFVFLHADTVISSEALVRLYEIAETKRLIVGSFKFKVNSPEIKYRILETLVEFRNYLFDLPFGDQVFFVSKQIWSSVGKFKEIPIMEDIEWIKRVSRLHDLTILPYYAETDGRRWKRNGFIKNSVKNLYLQFRYFMGDDPKVLAEQYYSYHDCIKV